MKAPPFSYHAPTTVADAIKLLAAEPNARPLAGGQSLMPMLNFRLANPDALIDLNRLAALDFIRAERDAIVIGAMTRQRTVEFSALIGARLPLLAQAIKWVGHRQTRNRGTIGGSLVHLDPSAEIPAVAIALDAVLKIVSPRGERSVPMAQFAQGIMTTDLAADELLVEVRLPTWPEPHTVGFVEFARRHGDFAIVSAGVQIARDSGGRITRAVIVIGGATPVPHRLVEAESTLIGISDYEGAAVTLAAAAGKIDAMSDTTYPDWYRRKLAITMSQRALRQAWEARA